MTYRSPQRVKVRETARRNALVAARSGRRIIAAGKRVAIDSRRRGWEMPPEQWHEPGESADGRYRIVVDEPGPGFVHVLNSDQVRERLQQVPDAFRSRLEVVHLSSMTRKKRTRPCYGLQWGTAVYLYPVEESLTETFFRPPRPAERIESEMYGGVWRQRGGDVWQLTWTPEAVRNFYLNNILMHELGHLVDTWNTSYRDRERFAEWFAVEYGYRAAQGRGTVVRRPVVRRHG